MLTVLPFFFRVASDAASGAAGVTPSDQVQRVLDSFASVRLLKLCRYYEGVQANPDAACA